MPIRTIEACGFQIVGNLHSTKGALNYVSNGRMVGVMSPTEAVRKSLHYLCLFNL